MKTMRIPMLTTIFFGLGCGICFIPLTMLLGFFIPWPLALHLTVWSYLALYGLVLTWWSRVGPLSIAFPLLLLLVFAFWGASHTAFLLTALVIMSWIRSGICFRHSRVKAIGAEIIICLGGGAIVTYFAPHTPATWAMVVWALFLIQALYFVFLGEMDKHQGGDAERDPFAEMRRRAERILSGDGHYEL